MPATPKLTFPECPRWHDGALWCSDMLGGHVWRLHDGELTPVLDVARPAGLGFLDDGRVVVASMAQPLVLLVRPGSVPEVLVDLSAGRAHLNDLVTDAHGRSYVDAYRSARNGGDALVLVEPDGTSRVVATELAQPNGMVITPDGATLLLAETAAGCITAFAIGADGSLSDRRRWAVVEGMTPDGMCLDAEGALWVGSYAAGEFLRVREGGEVVDRREVPGRWATACALGGPDGRDLHLCSAETTLDQYFAGIAVGHLDVVRVDVPAAR